MEIFYRIIFTIFFFLGIVIQAQQSEIYFEAHTPDYVSEGGQTYIFCAALINSSSPDSALISINASKIIFGDSAIIKNEYITASLPLQRKFDEYYLSLPDSVFGKINSQKTLIIIPVKEAFDDELNFTVNLFEGSQKIYRISSFEVNEEGKYLTPAVFKTYRISATKKNSLALQKSSSFTIYKKIPQNNGFSISFWFKTARDSALNFSIYEPATFDTLCGLKINSFGILTFTNGKNTQVEKDCFISPNAWYQTELRVNNYQAELFVNENKIASKELFSLPPDSIAFGFVNNSTGDFYVREINLKIKNDEETRPVLNLDFGNYNEIDSIRGVSFDTQNCFLEEDDFPVLISPPQINVSIGSAFTTVEFYNDKDDDVARFVLEKSESFGDFTEIYLVENPEIGKRYYYEDYNTEREGVLFYRVKQYDKNGEVIFSPQIKVGKAKINDFILEQNYPNPFNPSTSFTVEVIIPGYFKIGIYDLVGKEIQVFHDGTLTRGVYKYDFDAKDLPSGIYLLRVKSANQTVVKKMIFTK